MAEHTEFNSRSQVVNIASANPGEESSFHRFLPCKATCGIVDWQVRLTTTADNPFCDGGAHALRKAKHIQQATKTPGSCSTRAAGYHLNGDYTPWSLSACWPVADCGPCFRRFGI